MKKGRPTNELKRMKYAIELALLHWNYLIPKRFRNPKVFGIILKHELNKEEQKV